MSLLSLSCQSRYYWRAAVREFCSPLIIKYAMKVLADWSLINHQTSVVDKLSDLLPACHSCRQLLSSLQHFLHLIIMYGVSLP